MSYLHTQKEQLSYMRNVARDNGLTFKTVNVAYNGNQAFALFDRESGLRLSSDDTLSNWYEKEIYYSLVKDYADC